MVIIEIDILYQTKKIIETVCYDRHLYTNEELEHIKCKWDEWSNIHCYVVCTIIKRTCIENVNQHSAIYVNIESPFLEFRKFVWKEYD